MQVEKWFLIILKLPTLIFADLFFKDDDGVGVLPPGVRQNEARLRRFFTNAGLTANGDLKVLKTIIFLITISN